MKLEKSLQSTGLAESLKKVPNLDTCDLEAECCGPVTIPGLPQGVYVKYVQNKGGHEPMTLMVIDTPYSPRGDPLRVKDQEFLAAHHQNHNLISWHEGGTNGAGTPGPLYILISQLSMRDTVNAAENIRVAKR